MRPSRVLHFPVVYSVDSEHFRPVDGIDRDCVVRLDDVQVFDGSVYKPQAVYAAMDRYGMELDRGYAVSWEKTMKVLARLCAVVEADRLRRPQLVP